MYKDEMIQMQYITLKISPHHIHKTKAEHKHAIFVLCKIISEIIAEREDNPIPENVRNSLSDLVKRSKAELHAE